MLLLAHPAVVSFYWRQGVDLREVPLWQLHWAISDEYQTIVDEDPLAVRVDIDRDGATLSAVIDDDLSVDSIHEVRDG